MTPSALSSQQAEPLRVRKGDPDLVRRGANGSPTFVLPPALIARLLSDLRAVRTDADFGRGERNHRRQNG